jgi:hypothetical protein
MTVTDRGNAMKGERGQSSVLAETYLVAIVVLLAGTVAVSALGVGTPVTDPAPSLSVTHTTVDDGTGDETVAVTLEGGDSVNVRQLYAIGSEPIDVGGAPDTSTPADQQYASEREAFAESTGGNPPQVGIGDTWDAGETVYFDPEGSADGVTISIYWNTAEVRGVNPGTVEGSESFKLVEFTV